MRILLSKVLGLYEGNNSNLFLLKFLLENILINLFSLFGTECSLESLLVLLIDELLLETLFYCIFFNIDFCFCNTGKILCSFVMEEDICSTWLLIILILCK